MWNNAEHLIERIKRINKRMLVGTVLIMIFSFVWILIGFPAVAGGFSMVIEEGKGLSATAGIGMALLATALAGVMSWLYERTGQNRGTNPLVVTAVGRSLLSSAFLLTLFALLTPFVPEPQSGYAWWDTLIKWVCALSLMAGTIFLVGGVLLAILESVGLISVIRRLFQREMSD